MINKMKIGFYASALLAMGFVGCSNVGSVQEEEVIDDSLPQGAEGGEDNTFSHIDIYPDVWEIVQRNIDVGPAKFRARLHSCSKIPNNSLRNVLDSLGVDTNSDQNLSAGRIFRESGPALGAPNYEARIRENRSITTSSASKAFDIYVQAAPEIIDAMPNLGRCQIGGQGPEMFDGADNCTENGISCLIGSKATPEHVELCNETVTRASDVEIGKRMAVAVLAAAAHTCE